MKKRIYLDNAATTKLDEKVKKKMVEMMEVFGNPSSIYKEGRNAKKILKQNRLDVSKILNCDSEEIIFTGSGTESDNLAIFGVARANKKKGGHIITTKIEHHAVLHPMEQLEREGFEVTYLDVQKNGIIDVGEFKSALREDTILVSIMYANNEIGTVQPICEIAEILKDKDIVFHTDACQAVNYLDIDIVNLGVDLMTFSGSKIYGPKGVGVLYKSKDVVLEPIILGGGQENNFRSGTESLIMISGMVEALKITEEMKKFESDRLTELRDYFMKELENKIEKIHINGDLKNRLPNNVHISVEGIEGESLLLMLDEEGVVCATGSACSSYDLNISHVLKALGIPIEYSHGSLRFTLGRETIKEDLSYTVDMLQKITKKLRSFSSVKLD